MKVLSLMSGGRDSLLATCMMIEEGHEVTPFFCNNGHIEGIDRIYKTIEDIDDRYGTMISTRTVIANTAMTAHRYMQCEWYLTSEERADKYPGVQTYQIHCLCCRTAMFVHALAYCKANGLQAICDGVRYSQGFFVDSTDYISKIRSILSTHQIGLETPVFNIDTNFDRKRKLCDRGMPTKTFEPQCFLGAKLIGTIHPNEVTSLANFFDNELSHKIEKDVEELLPVYKRRL